LDEDVQEVSLYSSTGSSPALPQQLFSNPVSPEHTSATAIPLPEDGLPEGLPCMYTQCAY